MAHKQIIAIGFLAVNLLVAADATRAEDFSGKPIKLMVGASPGGTTDTMARAIATPLSTTLGRPVIVENRTPAGTLPPMQSQNRHPTDRRFWLPLPATPSTPRFIPSCRTIRSRISRRSA
jgi:hypothetical protein